MGLLGDGFDDPQSQMIMGLAQGLLSARGGAGLAAGLGNMQALQQNRGKQKLIEAQLANFASEIKAREQVAQQAMRKRDALPGLFSQSEGMSPGAFSPSADGMGPTMPQSMQGQQGGQSFDFRAALGAGYSPDEITKLAGLQNLGRSEVVRTIKGMGPGGVEQEFQVDKFGQKVGGGMDQYRAPISVNQGNRTTFADPYNLKPVGQFQTFQSPDSAASIANSRRTADMADSRVRERMAMDQGTATADAGGPSQAAFTKQFGKAEPGFRWKQDGTSEPIPGGSKDIKAGEIGDKRARQQQGAIDQADRIITKVDQSLAKVGYLSAGFGGSALGVVPGSDARNLKSDLETIRANLGFAELQAMRDASPTGGALGQVAVQELVALQSTVASLDQGQSQEQLKARLGEVKKHYENWKNAVKQSRAGADAKPSPGPSANIPADAINRLKMDPKLKPFFDQKYGAGASDQYLGR